ncbi:hypothetical protein [Streptomyces chartreusis]|uniref:hypothetical protein n=1 Tax=Streptomyces chartreusis TaxID=1969 RepID=UPI0036549894
MSGKRVARIRSAAVLGLACIRLFNGAAGLLGLDLLTSRDERLTQDLREGVLIHGSDTATAAMLGLRGHLAPRTAALTTLISAVNTALAVSALTGGQEKT